MRQSRFKEEQIMAILREQKGGFAAAAFLLQCLDAIGVKDLRQN